MHTSTTVEATTVEPTDLEPTAVELTAGFGALADATRLRILSVLANGCRCVCDLRADVAVPANVLSYHLKVLREAGLVTAERRGRWIDYRVENAALERLRGGVPATNPAAVTR